MWSLQKNPIEYLEKECINKNLVFASESIRYKDEPWGDKNLKDTFGEYVYEHFKNEEIFNVGVLAGHGYAIRDLALNIFFLAPIDQFQFVTSQHLTLW